MKVSVIIPVYNSEATIEKCLRSIMHQSYQNIEIIVIDDGSKDQSAKLLKTLAHNDERIILKIKKNEGVSKTRNIGIEMATGDFILFVDSDDYIDEDTVEKMVSAQAKQNADLTFCGYISENDQRKVLSPGLELSFNNKRDCLELLLNEQNFHLFAVPWGKLFKTEILKEQKIRFMENLSLGEDTCFVLTYLKFVSSLEGVSNCFYHIFVGNVSLSRSNHTDIWEIQKTLYTTYKELYFDTDVQDLMKKRDFMFFRGVRISLNTAVLYRWHKDSFVSLCNQIVTDENFLQMKIPTHPYYRLIYYLLRWKLFYFVFLVIKIKNKRKGIL